MVLCLTLIVNFQALWCHKPLHPSFIQLQAGPLSMTRNCSRLNRNKSERKFLFDQHAFIDYDFRKPNSLNSFFFLLDPSLATKLLVFTLPLARADLLGDSSPTCEQL